ncbi:MAG: sulfatase [Calditrichaeota bacterium]|nr:sulfatase [Calditrichota bacterium]
MSFKEKISRRNFLEKASLMASLPLFPKFSQINFPVPAKINNTKQRNVLLLISDDHGLDQLGYLGNKSVRTPNLDSMAEQGVTFTNAFCVAATCSASRGSILSGLFPHQNGQYGHQHNWHHFSYLPYVKSLPYLLKQNGYRTGLIGKLHVAPDKQLPFDFRVTGKQIMGNRDVKTMADKAGEFFNGNREQPFFLLVGYSDPHRSASGWSKMKNVENFSGFGNEKKYPGIATQKFSPDRVHVPDFLPDIPETRGELADQYQAIQRLDLGIGMILNELKKSGRFEDTLVIYLSDNGIPFPGAKTTLYDSGVRLPMIVMSPTLSKRNFINQALVSYVDLVPTILEWTQSPVPKYSLPGKSFLSILNEKQPKGWDEVYFSHIFHEITMYYPMRGVRTRRFKYIKNLFPELEFPFATDLFISKTWQGILKRSSAMMGKRKVSNYLHRPAEELYDLENDPAESINLAQNPAYAGILEKMRTKVQKMREQTDDHWLINDNYRANKLLYEKIKDLD